MTFDPSDERDLEAEEENEINHLRFLIRALDARITELERIIFERDDE